ncbi:hypothetical protein Y694_04750 [Methylibium sp. T29-B]|nr:hypothetical protein Y694_04750 [Methylibium sp. T29-B]
MPAPRARTAAIRVAQPDPVASRARGRAGLAPRSRASTAAICSRGNQAAKQRPVAELDKGITLPKRRPMVSG